MTPDRDNLPPERAAELAEHSIVGAEMPPQGMGQTIPELIVTCLTCGHMRAGEYTDHLAPLIGGWLAEAERGGATGVAKQAMKQAPRTFQNGYEAGKRDGAADVRARVEALAGEWERENAWGLGEQLASATRAALATEREEGER